MSSIAGYVSFAPEKLNGKVAQVCWGLIKGVAYLHEFCIIQRDFYVKIIDFDVSMQVKDEDEVVQGQCGTKGWMAPEIEEKSMYSPIKADRWSTGQVLLHLLNTRNPDQRSSMPQVAVSPSDVANVGVEKMASRSLQDTMEVNIENAKPPKMKKQKLSVPDTVQTHVVSLL